jgi:predicted hotdog family 3-hydroxylacyl-ACP dehydratase
MLMPPLPLDAAWIAARLPHAGRMCLLERVTALDARGILCEASSHRLADNPLRAAGRLGAACIVEYAAQAMALHAAARSEGDPSRPRSGLLVAVRDLRLFVPRLDDQNVPLRIAAWRLEGSGQAAAYGFEAIGDGRQPVARGRATLLLHAEGREDDAQR